MPSTPQGSIYPALNRLEAERLNGSQWANSANGRRRRCATRSTGNRLETKEGQKLHHATRAQPPCCAPFQGRQVQRCPGHSAAWTVRTRVDRVHRSRLRHARDRHAHRHQTPEPRRVPAADVSPSRRDGRFCDVRRAGHLFQRPRQCRDECRHGPGAIARVPCVHGRKIRRPGLCSVGVAGYGTRPDRGSDLLSGRLSETLGLDASGGHRRFSGRTTETFHATRSPAGPLRQHHDTSICGRYSCLSLLSESLRRLRFASPGRIAVGQDIVSSHRCSAQGGWTGGVFTFA